MSFSVTFVLRKKNEHVGSRFDLVHVSPGTENGTLVARMVNPGQTVLKVCPPCTHHIQTRNFSHFLLEPMLHVCT